MTDQNNSRAFSIQTRNNITLDMLMLISGLVSILSGIYFLFLPVGGFQGGRNPFYGMVIFFERHTWTDIHIWASVIIMALAALHIPLHWEWIVKMTKIGFRSVLGKSRLNSRSSWNLVTNLVTGISGLICGLSGLYFLLIPEFFGLAASASGWIFAPVTWDLIHTWSGVVMTAAGILHFVIHWNWVVKVLGKYGRSIAARVVGRGLEPAFQKAAASRDDNS